jgi:hypothetical protein
VFFCQTQKLKTETQSRSTTGRSTKRTSSFYSECYILFYLQVDHTDTLMLQFSNFKGTVIPTSLVILLVLEIFIICTCNVYNTKLSDVQWRANKVKRQIQSEVRTMYWLVHAKRHDNDFDVSLFLLAIVLSANLQVKFSQKGE